MMWMQCRTTTANKVRRCNCHCNMIRLVSTPNLRLKTVVICLNWLVLSPVSIQTQSFVLRALRLDGNRAKHKRLRWKAANHGCHCFDRASYWLRLARFPSKRNARNASDCVWMETGLYSRRQGWSAWVGCSASSVCLSVCLFVCPQHNSKTNDPKVGTKCSNLDPRNDVVWG